MRTTRLVYLGMVAVGVAALLSAYPVELGSQQNASVRIDKDDIGGVVRSAKGPEAGVWVIAETRIYPRSSQRSSPPTIKGATLFPICRRPITPSGCAATGSSIRQKSKPRRARLST